MLCSVGENGMKWLEIRENTRGRKKVLKKLSKCKIVITRFEKWV